MTQHAPKRSHHLPFKEGMVLFFDVNHEGVTAEGERFDTEPSVYRGHFTVEDAVLRYPDGRLKLVQRVVPARQCV